MKKASISVKSALFFIPWSFLSVWLDYMYNLAFPYYAFIAISIALGLFSRVGPFYVPIAGNLLSLFFSVLLSYFLLSGNDHYFKPFTAAGFSSLLWLISIMIQYPIRAYKREKSTVENYLTALCVACLALVLFLVLLLFFARISIEQT